MKNTMINENHESSHLSERILDTIEKQGITPKPKWHFFLKEGFVWGLAVVALFVGSVATALTLYIGNASRFIEHHIVFSDIRYLFQMIPLLWLFLFGIGVFYTVYALRETRRGYRWSPAWLVGLSLGVSVLIGASAYAMGASEIIDRYLLTAMPLYKPLTSFEPMHWMNGDEGVVAGVVTEVDSATFTIQKLDGAFLKIQPNPKNPMFEIENLKIGMRVRVVGTTTQVGDEEVFEMLEMAPFRGRGGMMMKGNPPRPPMKEMMYQPVKEN
jgi:hypothetical protein